MTTALFMQARRFVNWQSAGYVAVFAAVVLLVLWPILLLLINSFQVSPPGRATEFSLDAWRSAFESPSIRSALWNTALMITARQFFAFIIAVIVAWLLARTDVPGGRWLEFMFWVAFFLPTVPVVQAWILMMDPDFGLMNAAAMALPFVDSGPFNIYSFWGIIWVHLAHNAIAIKVMLLVPLFRSMDSSFEEASRLSGSSLFSSVWRITLPIMMPGLLAVFLIGTIYSLHSFEIEQILGPPFRFSIFSTEIYSLINQERPNFGAATSLSSLLLVALIPFILWHRRITSGRKYTTVSGRYRGSKIALRGWRYPVFAAIFALGLLTTLLPIAMLLVGSFTKKFGFFQIEQPWTLANWVQVFADPVFMKSLRNSVLLGVGTAVLGMAGFSVIGYIAVRSRFVLRGALDFLSWLPSVLPGIILSLGLLWLFLDTPLLRPLYGSLGAMIVATFVSTMTIGVQIIKSNLLQLGAELEESARISGGSWKHMYWHVILPLTMPVMLLVGALSFSLAVRNVSGVIFLGTGETRPLSLLQIDFMVQGSYEPATVVGIVVAVLTVSVAVLARLFGSRYELR